jgi:hypothetical protein
LFRIAGYVLAGILILCAMLFVFRNELAGYVVERYLAGEGVGARVTIARLDSAGLTLKVEAGPSDAPDVSADRIDVAWGPGRYGRRVEAVTLSGAYMHIHFDGKQISYGSLTDYIERMLKAPARESDFVVTDLPVTLKSLRVRITMQGGSIDLIGSGAIHGNRIEHLSLHAEPGSAGLYGYGYSYRADVKALALEIASARTGLNIAGSVVAAITGSADIPSLKLTFAANGVTAGGAIAIPKLRLAGDVRLALREADKMAASIPYWSGDAANRAALKAMLMDAHVEAPDLALSLSKKVVMTLSAPLTVTGQNGTKLDLTGAVAMAMGGGKASLVAELQGGGISPLAVGVRTARWTSAGTRTEGEADVTAGFTAQMLRGAAVRGKLRFAMDGISLRLDLEDCADLVMGGLRSGRNMIATQLRARVCAVADQPLYAMDTKGWRARLRFTEAGAHITAADARLSSASGTVMIGGEGEPKTGMVTIASAQLSDTARKKRFAAIGAAGTVMLADGLWRGELDVVNAARHARIGRVTFHHVLATGVGEATVDAHDVHFTEKGLQPVDLSPLLVNVAKAEGRADFTGHVGWRGSKISSNGELKVDDSSFATPLGTAHGGSVAIKFSSLLPIVAAPGQEAAVDKIDWVSALTKSFARFGFTQEKLTLQTAGTNAAKGTARLDPLTIYFDSKKGVAGRLVVDHIDIGQLLADSNLGEDVKIVATVSGTVPFEVDANGFRIREGKIAADGPGRLMIQRKLWLGSRTTTPNAVEDFAYQALENLAFDKLEGTLNSLPGGRMQLIFHIIGYNDPAKAQVTEVGVIDLLKGEAFQKPMPLPKGTPIDLTLDTNLNFDEILRAYREAWAETKADNRERITP